MIRLAQIVPPQHTLTELRKFQQLVDAGATYDERVELAGRHFARKNTAKNKTFIAVKQALTEMCSGARRCCYCEDSVGDEVEHIRPKSIYPELVFAWENYLYACGPCNGPKNNRFAVFAASNGQEVDVGEPSKPKAPPVAGKPVLIDPRQENPLDYMELDLPNTFAFVPLDAPGSPEYRRADYTIDLLGLNRRDYLLQARAQAYRSYRAHLVEYIKHRNDGAAQADLDDLINAIRRMGHPTVWHEMRRQRALVPSLAQLFNQAPESLGW